MTDYSELVRKMRTCIGDKKCFEKECRYWSDLGCMDGNICCEAADAIEALQREHADGCWNCPHRDLCADAMTGISELCGMLQEVKE